MLKSKILQSPIIPRCRFRSTRTMSNATELPAYGYRYRLRALIAWNYTNMRVRYHQRHGCIYSHASMNIWSIDLSAFRISKRFFFNASIVIYICSPCAKTYFQAISFTDKKFLSDRSSRGTTCTSFFQSKNWGRSQIFLIFRIFLRQILQKHSRFFAK